MDFGKIGSADLLVMVTGLAGNICTQYMIPIIQHAIKTCKDVVLVGVMPFDFEALTEKANENYLVIKEFPVKRYILRNQELLEEKSFGDLSIKAAFNLVNDTIDELIKKERYKNQKWIYIFFLPFSGCIPYCNDSFGSI